MDSVQMSGGRVFVLRLRAGEVLHEAIESFALAQGIRSATVQAVGGAEDGSRIVMGPRDGHVLPIEPILHTLHGQHEVSGVGTIFPDMDGAPILHMHASFGRDGRSVTGCVRAGVVVWLVMEVVLQELLGDNAVRAMDPDTGFALLEVGGIDR
ncbi:MAG: DNA-binding protein [Candidatus Methanomethylophilaceae archaeon]|nr:DNA-binding protein [Candidatus Methanomethylophilaceae archaeon]